MQENEKLRAIPKWHNPAVQHFDGGMVNGKFVSIPLPKADVVEVEAADDGFYLFRYSNEGKPLGDTHHDRLEAAFGQAEFEFGIQEPDWEALPNP